MSVCGREPSQLDGRGGSEPISEAAHHYIYYRLYTNDNPLESFNPIYANDKTIGRILFKSITPPRNVASLKKHLWKVEGFDGTPTCSLYLSMLEKVPTDDSSRLPFQGGPGSGSSELDAMALVVNIPEIKKRSASAKTAASRTLPESPHEPCYVHYRTYDETGEIPSKASFDETDTSLGRIDARYIPPPHNSISLKIRLSQAERISVQEATLYDSKENELNSGYMISFSAHNYPGISADEPIAMVYKPQIPKLAFQPQLAGFSKNLRANHDSVMGTWDSTWHSAKLGEIFQTDGVLTHKRYCKDAWVWCYVAINSSGKQGFIKSDYVNLL